MSRPRSPYHALPAERFWKRAVRDTAFFDLDPFPDARFRIGRNDRIVTAGSCFAQHLARALEAAGFHHLITEQAPPDLPPRDAAAQHYGIYSARYGNIYTAAHLRQLLEEAFEQRDPGPVALRRAADGRYVDMLRPLVQPEGFDKTDDVQAARQVLRQAVRRMVRQGDVLVFTMGLTEAWRMRDSGTILPVAPGAIAGGYDLHAHEFVNFSARQILDDMRAALDILWRENPGLRVVLSVSPVPLVATWENRHVIVSNTLSKSVLRVVADELERSLDQLLYFPSYEIITGHYNMGAYFEEDLRSVNAAGVAHVMRVVMQSLVEPGGEGPGVAAPGADLADLDALICDEDEIDPG